MPLLEVLNLTDGSLEGTIPAGLQNLVNLGTYESRFLSSPSVCGPDMTNDDCDLLQPMFRIHFC